MAFLWKLVIWLVPNSGAGMSRKVLQVALCNTAGQRIFCDMFDDLRQLLLALPPSGRKGFEGLIATAAAALTGLNFRLAKSGSQFGRDATTAPSPFAIAMEAKRYSDALTLEKLAGKATIAAIDLAGDIDLWVVGATSEVGEGTVRKLQAVLERDGISLLVLDWSTSTLPPWRYCSHRLRTQS